MEKELRRKLREEQGLLPEDDERGGKFDSTDPFEDLFSPPDNLDGSLLTSVASESGLHIPTPNPRTGLGLFSIGALLALSSNGGLRAIIPAQRDTGSSGLDTDGALPSYLISPSDKHELSLKATTERLQKKINDEKLKAIAAPQQTPTPSTGRPAPKATPSSDSQFLDEIQAEFTLNTEQAQAFRKVGDAFLSELRDPKQSPPPQQVCSIIATL